MKEINIFNVSLVALLAITAIMVYFTYIQRATIYEYESTISYQVTSGDTLWSIANEFSGEKQDTRHVVTIIKNLNGIRNPAEITPGMIIEVPLFSN